MRKIMLNGRWELAEAGKDTLCAVQVPGSVLSGLYGAGKIEDPFYRTNEDATRELFWKDYEFCRTYLYNIGNGHGPVSSIFLWKFFKEKEAPSFFRAACFKSSKQR